MREDSKRPGPDAPAQITVALVEFVQTALAVAARSYWRVLPNPLPLQRPDVLTTLSHMPKPIRVAPLAQPGALGTWPYTATSELEKTLFEQSARNLQNRVREILAPFTREGPVPVLVEHEDAHWVIPSSDVEQWTRDYVLDGVGWILVDSGGDPRAPVRFVLCRPDGTWFPALPRRPLRPDAMAMLEAGEFQAARFHHDVAGTEHILLALTRSDEPAVARTFAELGLNFEAIDNVVSRASRKGPKNITPRPGARTSRLRYALESAARIAEQEESAEVSPAHLLQALLADGRAASTMIAQVLQGCGQTTQGVADKLREVRRAA